jgi:hypothetical protein
LRDSLHIKKVPNRPARTRDRIWLKSDKDSQPKMGRAETARAMGLRTSTKQSDRTIIDRLINE